MLLDQKQINEMSKEELRELVESLRKERARGFERKTKATRKAKKSPLAKLSKEDQAKLLAALLGGKE